MKSDELDRIINDCAIDPRRGVPSASSMKRLENCPGSWLASKDLPEETSDVAESGTRIHKALETADYSGLSSDEQDTAERCENQADELKAAWVGDSKQCLFHFHARELRLGMTGIGGVLPVRDESTANFVLTGQADFIVINGERGLVLDYKTGRGEVEHAKDNAQLRALAVLVSRRWRLSSVRVAIVQPWAGKPSVADYDSDALALARGWLTGVLIAVNSATPDDLKAGEWCQYCKAKPTCPALRHVALAPCERMSMGITSMDDKTARAALFARAMECDAEMLAGLTKGLRLVGWYVGAIEGAAKKRAENDEQFQKWFKLKPGIIREKITDVGAVFQRVHELGVSPEDFTAACSLTKAELEGMVRKATGAKGMELKGKLASVLAGATESKETAPQLEEVEG